MNSGHFLVISPSRNISLPELFKYSLGPVPLTIATPKKNLVNTFKTSLLKELEKNSSAVNVVPCDSTWIVNEMVDTYPKISTKNAEIAVRQLLQGCWEQQLTRRTKELINSKLSHFLLGIWQQPAYEPE